MVLAFAIYYYSFSDYISSTLKWILLGINIILLLSFIIYDYGIQKRKVSKFYRILVIASIILTVIFSIFIFYF